MNAYRTIVALVMASTSLFGCVADSDGPTIEPDDVPLSPQKELPGTKTGSKCQIRGGQLCPQDYMSGDCYEGLCSVAFASNGTCTVSCGSLVYPGVTVDPNGAR